MPATETIEVSSVEQYKSVCAGFAREGKVYFRGQVTDYPQVLPSLFRPGAISDNAFEELISGLYISSYNIGDWPEMRQKYIDDFNDTYPDPVTGVPSLLPGGTNFNWPVPAEQPFKWSW